MFKFRHIVVIEGIWRSNIEPAAVIADLTMSLSMNMPPLKEAVQSHSGGA